MGTNRGQNGGSDFMRLPKEKCPVGRIILDSQCVSVDTLLSGIRARMGFPPRRHLRPERDPLQWSIEAGHVFRVKSH